MSGFDRRTCVVTGAGSGIGRALALALGQRGARLAVSDIDATGLAQTVDALTGLGVEAHAAILDVGDRDAVIAYADDVVTRFGVVNQVYNNAGIAGGSDDVVSTDWEIFDRVLQVNLWGVINGTKAFLPHLIASGDGHLVNISSLNGFTAQPRIAPYCTSKFGVRGFTETVRTEMLWAGHPVRVSVVHPGGVRTNIASNALAEARRRGIPVTPEHERRVAIYNEKLLRMPPEDAAGVILRGVERNKARILVGRDAWIADKAVRALPSAYQGLVVRLDRFAVKRFAQ